jgi:hypothetical protein
MSYTPPPDDAERPDHGDAGETPAAEPPPPPGYGTPPPPPGYGTPPPPPGYGGPGSAGPARNSSKAVAALVIGIVSVLLGFCCAVLGLVGIVAIVLGRSARKEIALSGGALSGDGMARAGVILGIIGSVVGVVMTILNALLLINGAGTFDFNTVG